MRNMAYRYRIYPDNEQEVMMRKTFGCCRFVYNRMLSDKKEAPTGGSLIRRITGIPDTSQDATAVRAIRQMP